jgi:NhaP-type Na+/H+ or K+/H+ antiporter
MIALVTVAVILVVYGAVSRPLDARGVTSAMVFVLTGLLVGPSVLGLVDVSLKSATAERVTELSLALLLFSDAARIDLHSLRAQLAWPERLLLAGLPLAMVVGAGLGLLVFPGIGLASAVLLSIMLAPTDAALGQRVVTDEAVPSRVRQALNVESGLNDGLAVPFFLVAVDISLARSETDAVSAVIKNAAEQIGYGIVAGIGAALLGALLVRWADRRGWIEGTWRQIMTLGTAVLAYSLAAWLGGSGFIGAFVGGLAFGRAAGARGLRFTLFTEEAGGLLTAVVWIGFGALVLEKMVPHLTWQIVLYAVLSLTIVRMVPVALAMVRSGARWPTVLFMGWFGPRGLASIVFGLLVVEEAVPNADLLTRVVACTVAFSVLAHGLSSVPLVAAYRRWYEAHTAVRPEAEEAVPTSAPRFRRQRAPDDPTPA